MKEREKKKKETERESRNSGVVFKSKSVPCSYFVLNIMSHFHGEKIDGCVP